jgi:hypothetical protein
MIPPSDGHKPVHVLVKGLIAPDRPLCQHIPSGQDVASVLLLGCGDGRDVLYTLACEDK